MQALGDVVTHKNLKDVARQLVLPIVAVVPHTILLVERIFDEGPLDENADVCP